MWLNTAIPSNRVHNRRNHAQLLIAARDLLIDTLRVQVARLKRISFGKSSGKLTREIAQLELALEELETAAAAVAGDGSRRQSRAERMPPVRSLPPHLLRLDVVPVSQRVVRHVRPKYSCRTCETIVQAPAPVKAIACGKATFATLAHIVVSKFDHHLPLYRQAEIMAAQGIDIDRSTLAGWTGDCG